MLLFVVSTCVCDIVFRDLLKRQSSWKIICMCISPSFGVLWFVQNGTMCRRTRATFNAAATPHHQQDGGLTALISVWKMLHVYNANQFDLTYNNYDDGCSYRYNTITVSYHYISILRPVCRIPASNKINQCYYYIFG